MVVRDDVLKNKKWFIYHHHRLFDYIKLEKVHIYVSDDGAVNYNTKS